MSRSRSVQRQAIDQHHGVDIGVGLVGSADLEAVVRIEFAAGIAREILSGHEGTEVDYAVNAWSRAY